MKKYSFVFFLVCLMTPFLHALELGTPIIKKKPDGTLEYLIKEEADWYRGDLVDPRVGSRPAIQLTQFGSITSHIPELSPGTPKLIRLFTFPISVDKVYNPRKLTSSKISDTELSDIRNEKISFTDQLTFQPMKYFIQAIEYNFTDARAYILTNPYGMKEVFDEHYHLYCIADNDDPILKSVPERFERFDTESASFQITTDFTASAGTGPYSITYTQVGNNRKITKTASTPADGSTKTGNHWEKGDMKILLSANQIRYYKKTNDINFFKKEISDGVWEDDPILRARYKGYPAQTLIDNGWIPYARYRPAYMTTIPKTRVPASQTMHSAYLDQDFCTDHTFETTIEIDPDTGGVIPFIVPKEKMQFARTYTFPFPKKLIPTGLQVVGGKIRARETNADFQMEALLTSNLSEMRTEIRKAAFTSSKNVPSGKIVQRVKYVKNADITLPGTGVTKKEYLDKKYDTIIVQNGNVIIDGDIDRNLGIIVLSDNYKAGSGDESKNGNVYITPKPTFIQAQIYTDGAVMAVDSHKKRYTSTEKRDNDLKRQLIIQGHIFSKNTIGATQGGDKKLPGGAEARTLIEAQNYDLNYLRTNVYGCITTQYPENGKVYCKYDGHVVVLPRAGVTPPPIFSTYTPPDPIIEGEDPEPYTPPRTLPPPPVLPDPNPTPPPISPPDPNDPQLCQDVNAVNIGNRLPCICKAGYHRIMSGDCVQNPPSPSPQPDPQVCMDTNAYNYAESLPCKYCPSGQSWNGWQCATPYPSCPSGQYWNGSQCACPYEGQEWRGGTCACPTGMSVWENKCQEVCQSNGATNRGRPLPCTFCPTGYHLGSDGLDTPMCVPDGCPHYWHLGMCECPMGQMWTGSVCVDRTQMEKCQSTGGTRTPYSTGSGAHYCRCPSPKHNHWGQCAVPCTGGRIAADGSTCNCPTGTWPKPFYQGGGYMCTKQ